MTAIVWALELCFSGTWQPRFTAPSLSEESGLRDFFESWGAECPDLPRRIKAYVRHEHKPIIERYQVWENADEGENEVAIMDTEEMGSVCYHTNRPEVVARMRALAERANRP